MVACQLAIAMFMIAAVDVEPVLLSPETIADYSFHLDCTFVRKAESDGQVGTVHLRFGRGASTSYRDLESFKSVSLMAQEGNTILFSTPVRAEFDPANYVSLYVKFEAQKDLLSKMQLAFDHEGTDGRKRFVVNLKEFVKEHIRTK